MGRRLGLDARADVSLEFPMQSANTQSDEPSRRFWQRKTGVTLSDEDIRQIVDNVAGYMRILAEWSDIAPSSSPYGAEYVDEMKQGDRPR